MLPRYDYTQPGITPAAALTIGPSTQVPCSTAYICVDLSWHYLKRVNCRRTATRPRVSSSKFFWNLNGELREGEIKRNEVLWTVLSESESQCHLSAYTTIFSCGWCLVLAQNYCIKDSNLKRSHKGYEARLSSYGFTVTMSNTIFSMDLRVSTFSRHLFTDSERDSHQGKVKLLNHYFSYFSCLI